MISLPNPKELKAILKVCRDFGVSDVEIGPLKVKFGELPHSQEKASDQEIVAVQPSEEEMLFWSTQPDPLAEVANQ